MNASVVVSPELPLNGVYQLSKSVESRGVSKVNLELVVEGLLVTVLPWTGLSTHRPSDVQVGQDLLVGLGLVLTSLIRVQDLWSSMVMQSMQEGLNDQARSVMSHERVACDLSCIQVQHGAQIPPSVVVPDTCEVCGPDVVGVSWHNIEQSVWIHARLYR